MAPKNIYPQGTRPFFLRNIPTMSNVEKSNTDVTKSLMEAANGVTNVVYGRQTNVDAMPVSETAGGGATDMPMTSAPAGWWKDPNHPYWFSQPGGPNDPALNPTSKEPGWSRFPKPKRPFPDWMIPFILPETPPQLIEPMLDPPRKYPGPTVK